MKIISETQIVSESTAILRRLNEFYENFSFSEDFEKCYGLWHGYLKTLPKYQRGLHLMAICTAAARKSDENRKRRLRVIFRRILKIEMAHI